MKIKGLKQNGQVEDKMKRQSWNIQNSSKLVQTHISKITSKELDQGSLKRVHSSEVGLFLVKLA